MPFTDPMADGPGDPGRRPARAQRRADMKKTLALVRGFRKGDDDDADRADGLLQSDLHLWRRQIPRRRQGRRRRWADRRRSAAGGRRGALPAGAEGRAQFHPPRDADHRRQAAAGGARNTSGFVYYVSITGITGSAAPDAGEGRRGGRAHQAAHRSCRSRSASASGRARAGARPSREGADGVVVGSALVEAVRQSLDAQGKAQAHTVKAVVRLVAQSRGTVYGPYGRVAAE